MKLSAFIIIFTLVHLLACAGDARCEELPAVKSIEFIGLKRIPDGAVRAKIAQRAGEPLNTGRVSDDVKTVYQMGYFEDVRVQTEPFEGGIRLIFAIKEKPYVTRVDFRGNEEIDDTKLRETITITPGSSADIVAVKENADKIYRLYEKEGYPLARVVPVISRISEDSIFLTYQIEEGHRVKIRDIKIKGNKALSTRTVKGAMKTSERWMFSFLTGGGRYEEEQLRSDIEKIMELYLNGGYMKAEVFPQDTEFSPDKKRMDITVEVREGEQYTVSSIGFRGNTAFTEDELMKKVKSQIGSLISMKALRADVVALTGMYTEKGHALADIYPDFIPEEEAGKLKVVFVVREGDVYSMGRISISGNLKTRDKVIRRELLLNEGDNFNSSLLRRSHQKIYNLNMFETLDFKPFYDPEKKTMDIDVEVKERPTGSVSIGGGYSSVDKLIGMVEITEGNLGGRGQYLKLKGEFSSRSTTYELSFRDPWFLDYPVSFTTSVYNTRREYVNYEKRASGFTLGFGKRFLDYW
ncbi:MAG: outer membrane protein assembly factor BamA, partial [Thermodesulfovibrionales bacterium]|nr:outer membrane protein assembly factor BamA [Thermodesulfovibrionales bacterium]